MPTAWGGRGFTHSPPRAAPEPEPEPEKDEEEEEEGVEASVGWKGALR